MKADAKTEAGVMAVMNRYNETYAKRDVEGVLSLFAPDTDIVIIGTGADERRIGRQELKTQLERDFAQSEAAAIEFLWHSVSAAGSVAWLAADCIAHVRMIDRQEIKLTARMTAVLQNRQGRWLILQSHASIPMAGQSEGQSFPK